MATTKRRTTAAQRKAANARRREAAAAKRADAAAQTDTPDYEKVIERADNLETGGPATPPVASLEPHVAGPATPPDAADTPAPSGSVGSFRCDPDESPRNPAKMSSGDRVREALSIIADNISVRNEEDATRLDALIAGHDTVKADRAATAQRVTELAQELEQLRAQLEEDAPAQATVTASDRV